MGVVFKGLDGTTGDTVALKLVRPREKGDEVMLRRFEREFEALRKLNHPHIVRGREFGRDGNFYYLVMDFVDGGSLGDRLDRDGRLLEDEAVRLIVQAALGLHEAHRVGLVHRDVKPDNVLLGSDGGVRLTDLGLVKNFDTDQDLTRPQSGLGTPNFMAPEQFGDAKHADVRCDVYSLGATLYMMVTGKLPFAGRGLAVLKKKMTDDLTPPRKLVPKLSERVDLAIRRAVRADPAQRFPDCLQFVEALTGTKPNVANPAVSAPTGPRPQSRLVARPAKGSERRLTVRLPARVESSVQPVGHRAEQQWSATIQDVSTGGVCLLARRRFEPRTVLSLEFPGSPPQRPRRLLVRVVRAQSATGRQWSIGCRFASPLTEDEVETLR